MKTKIFTTITVFAVIILTFIRCAKDGPVGPTGPQGPAGPSAQYVDITATFDGTSSFVLADMGSVYFSSTDEIITYFKDPTNNNWLVQTPFTWYNAGSAPYAYFWALRGSATLWIYAQKPGYSISTPAFTTPTTEYFRAVIIKASARKANPNVNYENYQEVKKAFSLKD